MVFVHSYLTENLGIPTCGCINSLMIEGMSFPRGGVDIEVLIAFIDSYIQ